MQRLDLRYPGTEDSADAGEFVVSAVGNPDGDGRAALVYGVTLGRGDCYILAYRHDGAAWRAEPISKDIPAVDLVRSIALGDLDKDGADEIVLGTLAKRRGVPVGSDSRQATSPRSSTATTMASAPPTPARSASLTQTAMANLEILVATARASAENWHATPGAIFLYRNAAGWLGTRR